MAVFKDATIARDATLALQVWADGDRELSGAELACWLSMRPEGVAIEALFESRIGLVLHVAEYSWRRIK